MIHIDLRISHILFLLKNSILLRLANFSLIILASTHCPVRAQIVPDTSLPNNTTVSNNGAVLSIDGGTTNGTNLFHSFERFSVPTGTQALFNNPTAIENIFSRVTGSSVSNIDGVLQGNGSANLFLINPNGIMFGANAALNIGGSFIASSADRIDFQDGFQFSAIAPVQGPQLTISQPIGLGFGGNNSGAINLTGPGHTLTTNSSFTPLRQLDASLGLQVQPGRTLAIVGGNILAQGSTLRADLGRVELGSVRSGVVGLEPTSQGWALDYANIQEFADINLSQKALLDTNAGAIQVQGKNITITDGSVVFVQNAGDQPSGNIRVHAAESLNIIGTSISPIITSSLANENLGSGKGGDILVSSKNILLQDGGQIFTRTFGNAESGNILVTNSESIQVIGFSSFDPAVTSNILANAGAFSPGNTGDVTISTKQLFVADGGLIASATLGFGNAGDVTIDAEDSVEISGIEPILLQPSAIGSSTLNFGNAGNLTINTKRLSVQDGGRVDASTFTSGNAGNLVVNATEAIEVRGTAPGNSSSIISSANELNEPLQQLFGLPPEPSGNSGNVTITTPALQVLEGAQITVRHDGTGDAGLLKIDTQSLTLDTQGSISASTLSGQGGNLDLDINDLLLLRRNSLISAEAKGTGDGGNLKIRAGLIVAFPDENSDILANAFGGNGGRIQITTQGLIGIEPTDQPTLFQSDINASSEQGIDGVVEINNPEVDPSDSLTSLPEAVLTPKVIEQGCKAGKVANSSSFVNKGRGGIPTNPSASLGGESVWRDLRPLQAQGITSFLGQASPQNLEAVSSAQPKAMVEAKGWQQRSDGKVMLIAHRDNSNHSSQPTASC